MKSTRALVASQQKFLSDVDTCEVATLLNTSRVDQDDIGEFAPSLEYMSTSRGYCRKLLPKLMLLGLPHAGSTTMASILNDHPNISFGAVKEHRFWTGTGGHIAHGGNMFDAGQCGTVECYEEGFRVGCNVQLAFDATPATIFLGDPTLPLLGFRRQPPGREAVAEVREMLGRDLKMVLVVRDPVDWIYSIYNEWALQDSGANKVAERMTCLANSLESWLQVFPKEQFMFIKAEDFFGNVTETLNNIFMFANVRKIDGDFSSVMHGRRRNRRRPSLEERQRFHRDPFNRECKRRLEVLTGLTLPWQGGQ
eukprot:CAMPEP_0168373744 /NCGR_PEP_ID=MMETSP0228-20121227/8945_1 /TAXON_ID=133427 /ORGANISM="Protoceratium reticulatum, Strain CCCM 535 (=CCMP 1889)" /LENGTH=308 /DNA_ID=CAMNT_0008386673 /DNA_START=208 /DNA_END=1134 /DNA_ORIENTATION=-